MMMTFFAVLIFTNQFGNMLANHDHALWQDEKLPIGHQIQRVNTHHKELTCTLDVRTCGCVVFFPRGHHLWHAESNVKSVNTQYTSPL